MENKPPAKRKIKMELHPNEAWVIGRWRKYYRFGTIEIKMSEGLPQFIEKVRIREYPPRP